MGMEEDNVSQAKAFEGRVWKTGTSLVVTLPFRVVNFFEIEEGDLLEMLVKIPKQRDTKKNTDSREKEAEKFKGREGVFGNFSLGLKDGL
ncbi:MAG: hypothetical protein A2W22_05465 [Candidatus Levybacteria bacterium RBG_16_35_11]|nr:MAG: hypothetical protein A2W22_05465 [Candidatus Levybacteria bacterium RBG_16_35_11]